MSKKGHKQLYSIIEIYWIVYYGLRTMKYMVREKRNGDINSEFIERLMLAVTEVNQCAVCSYAHSKMALEMGMSSTEIKEMLNGEFSAVPNNELSAVMFAQHYADQRGRPTKESWEQVINLYGREKAQGILGSIRAIMMGNAYGIAWGSFFNRFKRKADPRSNIFYELMVITVGTLLIPLAIVHSLLADLLKFKIISFNEE